MLRSSANSGLVLATQRLGGITSRGTNLSATLMKGGPLAERVRAEVADDVRELGQVGLATVQVGEDPASTIYIRRKHEAAGEVGIRSIDIRLPVETTEEDLVDRVTVAKTPLPDWLREGLEPWRVDAPAPAEP